MPEKSDNSSSIHLNDQDEVRSIIGHPPGWTLRWAMTVLFVGILLLLALSWFIRYPDIVEARTVLTTENPPIRLVARASAKISSLLVKNGQQVQAEDLLAVLDNPARLEDVRRLEDFVKNLEQTEASSYPSVNLPEHLTLGSLQDGYARFSQNFRELQYFLKQESNFLKISNLRWQIAETESINYSHARQVLIFEEEVALTRKNYERDSLLLNKKSGFPGELEQSKATWLRSCRELESLRTSAVQNNLRIRQMEAQILDLQQLQSDNHSSRLLSLRSDLQRLHNDLESWKQTWLLTAPIGGEVALTKAWSGQQFVREGEEVLTIVPKEAAGRLIAKALLPGSGAGKVTTGMEVHIRLDGYPYQEFGVLNGKVQRIASVPDEAGYEVEITLSDSLTSSHKKVIPFRQEMQGTARIITEERSFLVRVFEKLKGAGK